MKVQGTKVGSDGTGYYRGSDGKYYYGNPQNGYLKETIESQRQSEQVSGTKNYGNMGGTSATGSPDSTIGDGGLLIQAAGVVAASSFMATVIVAALIIAIVFSVLSSWPRIIGILVECYKARTIDFAVILLTAVIAFLVVYFVINTYIVITKKEMRSKHFWLVSTIVLSILLAILNLLASNIIAALIGGYAISIVFNSALYGVSLSSLPTFFLCFVEHVATKKIRGDKQWFITKISKIISRFFGGHTVIMIILGVLVVLLGLFLYWGFGLLDLLDYEDATIKYLPHTFVAVGITSVVMGILASKK